MKPIALAIAASAMLVSGACFAQPSQGNTAQGNTAQGNTAQGNTAQGNTAAQRNTAAAAGNGNQAVATTSANAPRPAHGANSFTMAQARTRMAKDGYQDITGLKKDANGVWHARAQKDGTTTMVWLDYKGNVGQSQ